MSFVVDNSFNNMNIHSIDLYNSSIQSEKIINDDTTGSLWLNQKIKSDYSMSDYSDFYLAFALIMMELRTKNTKELKTIFPDRKVDENTIQQLSVSELINLDAVNFFSIIDLISGEQAMQILDTPYTPNTNTNRECKMALYFFNSNLAPFFASQQRLSFNAPMEEKVERAAQQAFENYAKYSQKQITDFRNTKEYDELENKRMNLSDTLKNDSSKIQNWKEINHDYLDKGIEERITKEFLKLMNDRILASVENEDSYLPPEALVRLRTGYRLEREEVSDPNRDLYYFPGQYVEKEIEYFIEWFNINLSNCDDKKANPIVFAALTYQRFVSIHPFHDGNGRTGRLLADSILRRYGLLPATWEEAPIAIFPCGKQKGGTTTQAVEKILKALEQSYQMLEKQSLRSEPLVEQSVKKQQTAEVPSPKILSPKIPSPKTQTVEVPSPKAQSPKVQPRVRVLSMLGMVWSALGRILTLIGACLARLRIFRTA